MGVAVDADIHAGPSDKALELAREHVPFGSLPSRLGAGRLGDAAGNDDDVGR